MICVQQVLWWTWHLAFHRHKLLNIYIASVLPFKSQFRIRKQTLIKFTFWRYSTIHFRMLRQTKIRFCEHGRTIKSDVSSYQADMNYQADTDAHVHELTWAVQDSYLSCALSQVSKCHSKNISTIDVLKENVQRFIAIFKGVYKSENNPITALFFIRKDVIPPVVLLESFRRIDATSSWSIVDCE